jgi:hypothetical protein
MNVPPQEQRVRRQFGGLLGVMLVLLGLSLWDGPRGLGLLLPLCGALVAGAFYWGLPGTAAAYRGWMRFARISSAIFTRVCLSLVFFFVVVPTALLARALGKRFLDVDHREGSYWRTPDKRSADNKQS